VLELNLAAGEYRVVSLDPVSGDRREAAAHNRNGDPLRLTLPQPTGDEMAFYVLLEK
jgi:hypothetical protein